MLTRMRLSTATGMWLIAAFVLVVSGCGSVSHSAQFESGYTPKADTRIGVGPVTNDTGQTFDVNIQQMH